MTSPGLARFRFVPCQGMAPAFFFNGGVRAWDGRPIFCTKEERRTTKNTKSSCVMNRLRPPFRGGRGALACSLGGQPPTIATYHPTGTFFSISASHTAAFPSDGARQSPRGDNDPPAETFGPFGIALRLNCEKAK